MKKYALLVFLLTLGIPFASQAKPPSIDYQFGNMPIWGSTCVNVAKRVMAKNGFTRRVMGKTIVGVRGNYKAVIVCNNGYIMDEFTAIFIVAGPKYSTAENYAIRLRNNWDSAYTP
jgi:hypothetical protein